jgi:hypothetical protein
MRNGVDLRQGSGDRERLEAFVGSGIWTADPGAIIEKVRRGKQALGTFGVAR